MSVRRKNPNKGPARRMNMMRVAALLTVLTLLLSSSVSVHAGKQLAVKMSIRAMMFRSLCLSEQRPPKISNHGR